MESKKEMVYFLDFIINNLYIFDWIWGKIILC